MFGIPEIMLCGIHTHASDPMLTLSLHYTLRQLDGPAIDECFLLVAYYFTCSVFQNQQPGAEEAFKILGQAFEPIGNSVSLFYNLASHFYCNFLW